MRTPNKDDGFTLLDVVAALLVLSVAAVTVTTLLAISALSIAAARSQTWATRLAAEKLDHLNALAFAYDASGAPVTDTRSDLTTASPMGAGVGLTPSPPDALSRNYAGYAEYLDEAGRSLGADAAALPRAVYIRRWSVQGAGAAVDSLVLRVVVLPVAAAARAAAAGGRPGVLLSGVRTRTAS